MNLPPTYKPGEHEAEKASNSYLMSLVAAIAGMPMPIVNLLATFFFFLGNRKGTYFVRWHCTQALLSQLSLFFINAAAVWWTIAIIFSTSVVTSSYVAYVIVVVFFNVIELVATIYTAVQTRKGNHVKWWFYGAAATLLCRQRP